jgi:hypothetical protein
MISSSPCFSETIKRGEAMTYIAFHSVRDTTFHVFRYGRSHLHAATFDRTGALLPPQDIKGVWRHAWDCEYHEGDAARGFHAETALSNIESEGYHLFNFHPRIDVVGQHEAISLSAALDAKVINKLLKPVDMLLFELKSALEHYNADETFPQLRAENWALLKKAEAMTHRLDEMVF